MKSILFLIFLFALLSCKKDPLRFQIKGTVSDLTFNKGLAGARLQIRELAGNGSVSVEPIVDIILPENGTYDVNFERKSVIKYLLEIKKNNYFLIEKEIPFGDLSTEEATVKNFSTTAMAWVKLKFVNVAPASSNDQLRFIKQLGKEGCSECCTDGERFVNGIKDSVFFCVNDANSTYSYFYEATNPFSQGFNEIYTPAFDTVELIKSW